MPRAPYVSRWWAQRWLRMLDDLGPEWQGRLGRARTYAHDGSVLRAAIGPGGIVAQVRGSYGEPYDVRIEVAAFSEETWDRIVDALACQAFFVAKLLARDLPPEIEDVCAAAGGKLFPDSLDDTPGVCTCLDPVRPCKHILALHHVLATNLDSNPALLFLLRGRSGEELTAALRHRWSAEVTDATTPEDAIHADDGARAGLRAAHFFEAGPELGAFVEQFRAAEAPPALEAALLLRLGRPPFAGPDEDPLPILAPIYAAVTERALQARKRGVKRSR